MVGKDNAVEFTETKYCSRREMSNELGILIPEEMWKKVLNYRQVYNISLNLRDAENRDLVYCFYPTLASKCSQLENKVLRLQGEVQNLNTLNGDQAYFKLSSEALCLKALAVNRKYPLEEQRLRKLIASENAFDDAEEKLLNYHEALEYIRNRFVNKIDSDFLAELYSRILGVEELTSFYRDEDIEDADSKSLVSRIYRSAPHEKIEDMMERLFAFLESSSLSAISKAVVTLYYVSYVKPFMEDSDLIATLLAKAVLAHFSLGELAVILPLEELLNRKELLLKKMNQEVQTSADITYFVSPTIIDLENLVDSLLDATKEYKLKEIHEDYYQLDEQPKVEEVVKVAEKVVVQPKVEEKKVVIQEPVVEEVKEEVKAINNEEIAIGYIPTKIDEKEAARLTEHLLEMDYRLKKKEAYFYARHCTLGMYYTIDQFKKATKCVYETARTSMEHLVELGYYKKAPAGKKFVYTPIKRK